MTAKAVRVLVVDDSPEDYRLFQIMLSKIPYRSYVPDNSPNLGQAVEWMRRQEHDLYLVDYRLGPDSGLDFLREAAKEKLAAPIIILTGYGDHNLDLEAMVLGAADFLSKNKLDPDLLERSVRYALERKEAKESLQKRTHLLSSILENMAEGVATLDKDGRIVFFNQAAEKMLGKGPSRQTSEHWAEEYGLFLPDKETPFTTEELPLVKALKGEGADNVEMFVHNGQKPQGVSISVTARPLRDESGRLNGAVAVFRDVTALKGAEEQLLRHSLYSYLTGLP